MLDSAQKFCIISAGFLTEIVLDIFRIPRTNSVRYLLDSTQKFCSIYIGFSAVILFYICWIAYRNSTR